MRRLNHRWRGRDRTTDVLAFPLEEGEFGSLGTGLGDVVISLDTARHQAEERGLSLEEEVERLLVHGILHLVGYDHERSPEEARRMQRKERAVRLRLRRILPEGPPRAGLASASGRRGRSQPPRRVSARSAG